MEFYLQLTTSTPLSPKFVPTSNKTCSSFVSRIPPVQALPKRTETFPSLPPWLPPTPAAQINSPDRGKGRNEAQVPACKSWEQGDTCMKGNRTSYRTRQPTVVLRLLAGGFAEPELHGTPAAARPRAGQQLWRGRSAAVSLLPCWEALRPSNCVPVELKPVRLVCADKCKSRADKGISSFHRLRLARSTAAACLLLAPGRGSREP